ncbi:Tetrapyrrole biosynthesis [Melia azedarach]|uniref:Tetrapyrrole biosynthesis n=1 Tax=Melia azedarach TaxID=155640 RepID=A0ACC1YUZ8_MELAZ|nr:Tetrapyrrole biosynthesis [Melia azedarach]
MVVLPIPCSCSLPSLFKLPTNKTRLVCSWASTSFATANLTANPQTSSTNNTAFSTDLSLRTSWPRTLAGDQVLIKEDEHQLNIKGSEEEGLEKEVAKAITRLNMVVERIREMGIQNYTFTNRVKEDVSCNRMLAEEMSRDIVSKFLERPIQYLMSEDGNLEEKLKDVSFLVSILEKSCPAPNQTR